MLTGISSTRACLSHYHHRHLQICLQIQFERAATVRFARFDFFKLDCVCSKASDDAVLMMLTYCATLSKKLK
jgi:hypothetical protein